MKFLASLIWHFSERHGWDLGRLAPWIFGLMIGSFPHKRRDRAMRRRG